MKKAKAQHVAKPAKPAKPPRPAVQQLQHQVAVLQRQVASLKHPSRATAKHTHHGKKAASKKHAVKRGWSPDEDVALCSARAVAEHLRLVTGLRVADADVLALHRAAGGDDDTGASIRDALGAAQRHGLAGHFPVNCRRVIAAAGPVIIGVRMPGGQPHSVVYHDGGYWSWGEPFDPAGCQFEECWTLEWPA